MQIDSPRNACGSRSWRSCCSAESGEVEPLVDHNRTLADEEEVVPDEDDAELQEMSQHLQAVRSGPDAECVIQFSCAVYFCQERERYMKIDVVRFGDASKPASVRYRTKDGSAKAGEKYVAVADKIIFAAGETSKDIEVELIDSDAWNATLEFGIELHSVLGARLGMYLYTCRVMIIDEDSFPTNKHRDYFAKKSRRLAEIDETELPPLEQPGLSLFFEYCKMNLMDYKIRRGFILTLLLDQVKNLYFFLTVYLQMYLVDVVLAGPQAEGGEEERRLRRSGVVRRLGESEGEEEGALAFFGESLLVPGSRMYTAIIVGALYIVPFAICQCIDLKKLSFQVAQNSRLVMQANLLRKFLNYREEHRAKLSLGDITMAMVRDVTEVIDFGFMKALSIVSIAGKLMLALIFILAENRMAVIPLTVYPFIMGVFLTCRMGSTTQSCEEMAAAQNEVVHSISDTVNNYRLIADFAVRPFMVDRYETKIKAFNKRELVCKRMAINNAYLPPWLTTLLVGCYMMLAPFQVETCGGTLTLGAFLATINVFKEIGVELSEIYEEVMEILKSLGPLLKVSTFMNYETELSDRMRINRMRRKVGHEKRMEKRSEVMSAPRNLSHTFAVDLVKIEISDFCYSFASIGALLNNVNLTFEQGKMYAFTGPPHQGKATLLKLIGQVLPTEIQHSEQVQCSGRLFIPPHLRVLHVSQETFILNDSFLVNLVFNTDLGRMGGLKRIMELCRLMGLPAELLKGLQRRSLIGPGLEAMAHKEEKGNWLSLMSHSDFARLNLVRALIMNPELLVMQKPTIVFDESEQEAIIALIRRHVDERGIALGPGDRRHRRPRTVFYTASSRLGTDKCDGVYHVSRKGITLQEPKDVPLDK
eukprot:TRINITY_DN14356_c0_g1_i2.p1 TRINITY_DN14356_c0_g1~~TRINITY_DN14356_c0_g1_i2.p1  ORF type:complete len:873 (-),score=191.78 TRINITY_DN14356_c0_g1_i2:103-2721(-)